MKKYSEFHCEFIKHFLHSIQVYMVNIGPQSRVIYYKLFSLQNPLSKDPV